MIGARAAAARAGRHPWLLAAAIVALAAVGVLLLWRATQRPSYDVEATITLTGGSCASHRAECAKLADGGTIAVYAGSVKGRARLHGAVTHVHFSLEPGAYLLAFRMSGYSVLITDLVRDGDGEGGGFRVLDEPLDLGVVRPSPGFTYEGD